VFRGIILNRKKSEKNFIVEKTIAPLREGSGKIAHFISTDRDITERCRPETQLQQAGEWSDRETVRSRRSRF
jgi:hypothetical protein